MRCLTADTHPDHDSIAAFRRENFEAVAACFVHVLELARESKLLKVGRVSVDGTTLKASASKDRNVRYDRAGELAEQLEVEVKELMGRAGRADRLVLNTHISQCASDRNELVENVQGIPACLGQPETAVHTREKPE